MSRFFSCQVPSMRIGVDVGGTFTDVVLSDESRNLFLVHKLPSTPSADSTIQGLQQVLDLAGLNASQPMSFVAHGSTIATNAVIERRGAEVALLTTRGFRDVLEIRRLGRPAGYLYDLFLDFPPPLVRRALRFEVTERVGYTGSILTPLDKTEVRRIASELKRRGITSVATCYLFSFVNPEHERQTRAILAEELPGVNITLSSDVLPEFREYERTSTTVLHAYLKPLISGYLRTLAERVRSEAGLACPLFILQSNGGLSSPGVIADRPATALLSGPSGGVVASSHLADQIGINDLITVDMGGTSFDVSILREGRVQVSEERCILEHPLRVPMVDIHTIGAGGGSIAWLDEADGLHVGPHSAGSDPGPACYGHGGTEPTVTDANVLLGLLAPESFLGGKMRIHPELAFAACEKLSDRLEMSVLEVAAGIRRVVNNSMAGAIRTMTVKKGHDPREFALLAYGGAGPLHAADLMQELDIPWLLVPEYPGCFSAQGAMVTDVRHDYVQSIVAEIDRLSLAEVEATFQEMSSAGRADLERDGISPEHWRFERSLELRYKGQSFGLNVPVADRSLGSEILAAAIGVFHDRHEHLYGFKVAGARVELVGTRLSVLGCLPRPTAVGHRDSMPGSSSPGLPRSIYLPGQGELEAQVYARTGLAPGNTIAGPAIIEQMDTTTVIPPGLVATVHDSGVLIIGRRRWGA